jgi:plasmid stabilization system protein ParE
MVIKKSKVIISNKARETLRSYVKFLNEEVSPEMAEYVRAGIIEKCKKLKDFSGYSVEPYLETKNKKYRSVTIWNFNIIYTVQKDSVKVLNIIHTSQHPDKRKNI